MRVVFFDIGAYIGEVTEIFIKICKELNISYEIHQFEPSKAYVKTLKEKFKNDSNVYIHPFAITDKEGECLLYKSKRPDGYSLYSSKWNVDKNDFEEVTCGKFSNWYNTNKKEKAPDEIYIVKSNINGSEWEFFKDLISSGINKMVDLYCGKILKNIEKTGAHTPEQQEEFKQYLHKNGINEIVFLPSIQSSFISLREAILQKSINLQIAEAKNIEVPPAYDPPEVKVVMVEPKPKLRKERPTTDTIKEINR